MKMPIFVQTNYTLLTSLIKIDDLIEVAKTYSLSSLAICDNQMFGTMEFYNKCRENGIKPIIGLEVRLENSFVLLYAKNYNGYQTLIKLSTIQSERQVLLEDILKTDDLVMVVPFENIEAFKNLRRVIGEDNIYLAYRNSDEKDRASKYTSNILFVNQVLYINRDDKKYLKYLWMIRDSKQIGEITYNEEDNQMHLEFIDKETNVSTNKIISMCNLEFPKKENLLPIYDVENPYLYLTNLSKKGLYKRLNGKVTLEYQNRLLYELETINKMGFANYFLVVYDFIRYAKQNNILVGPGRGSAAGSLVSYSLGITDIDPIKYDLLFERFLNPERVTMPDIDTDFPDIYRDQVIEYVKNKYGEKRVSGIVTFGTLAPKLALRDVARVFNISTSKIDFITKRIPNVTKLHLKDFYKEDKEIKNLIDTDEELRQVFKIACRIESFPRHTSSHAAGIIMSKVDLDEVIPLVKNDDIYLTGYSMEYLEDMGLLKMDFLGLKNLTTIMKVLEDIKIGEGININFNQIPLNDEKTLELFRKGDTTGIFQFESTGMRNFLRNLKPTSFEDIFAAIALFRPGPASNIDTFIRRKEGLEEVTYIDDCLEDILKNTYGIIVYQEQIMQISRIFAGYTLGQADILRRAVSKKKYDVLKKEEENFIKKSIAKGHTLEKAKEVFELILKFANYGFNRSHSVAYSIIAYKMAYLKVRYPKYFYANLLSSVIGVESKTKEYINEIKGLGINVLKPDINKSHDIYTVESDGIRFPLSNIKNIGTVACKEILASRKEKFKDIYDFLSKTTSRVVNKKVLMALIDSDSLSSFGYNHKTLYKNLDVIMNYATLIKDLDEEFVLKPEIVYEEEFENDILIQKEKELFGMYLTTHPVTKYKIRENNLINLTEIRNYFDKKITVIVLVEKIKKIITKKGEEMAFVYTSDEYTSLDITFFPKQFKINSDIKVGDILKITGTVERRYDTFQLIAEKAIKL